MFNSSLLSLRISHSYAKSPFFQYPPSNVHRSLKISAFHFNFFAGKFLSAPSNMLSLSIDKSSFSRFNGGFIRISNDDLPFLIYENEQNKTQFHKEEENLEVTNSYFRYMECETSNSGQIIFVQQGNLNLVNNFFYEIICNTNGSLIYLDSNSTTSQNFTCTVSKNSFTKIISQDYSINLPWMIYIYAQTTTFSLNSFERTYTDDFENSYSIILNPADSQTSLSTNSYDINCCNFSLFKASHPGFAFTFPLNVNYSINYLQFMNGTASSGCFALSFQYALAGAIDAFKDLLKVSYCNFFALSTNSNLESASCVFIVQGIITLDNCVFSKCSGKLINAPNNENVHEVFLTSCTFDQSNSSAIGEFITSHNTDSEWEIKSPSTIDLVQKFEEIPTRYILIEGYETKSFTPTPNPTPLPSPNSEKLYSSNNSISAGTIATIAAIISFFYFIFLIYLRLTYNTHYHVIGLRDDTKFSSDDCLLIKWWKRRHAKSSYSYSSSLSDDNQQLSTLKRSLLDDAQADQPQQKLKKRKRLSDSDSPESLSSASNSSDDGPKRINTNSRKKRFSSSSD